MEIRYCYVPIVFILVYLFCVFWNIHTFLSKMQKMMMFSMRMSSLLSPRPLWILQTHDSLFTLSWLFSGWTSDCIWQMLYSFFLFCIDDDDQIHTLILCLVFLWHTGRKNTKHCGPRRSRLTLLHHNFLAPRINYLSIASLLPWRYWSPM